MSNEIATEKQQKWDDKLKDWKRVDVPVPPIRRIVEEVQKRKWFSRWDTRTIRKNERLEYFWDGEWVNIPTTYKSTIV